MRHQFVDCLKLILWIKSYLSDETLSTTDKKFFNYLKLITMRLNKSKEEYRSITPFLLATELLKRYYQKRELIFKSNKYTPFIIAFYLAFQLDFAFDLEPTRNFYGPLLINSTSATDHDSIFFQKNLNKQSKRFLIEINHDIAIPNTLWADLEKNYHEFSPQIFFKNKIEKSIAARIDDLEKDQKKIYCFSFVFPSSKQVKKEKINRLSELKKIIESEESNDLKELVNKIQDLCHNLNDTVLRCGFFSHKTRDMLDELENQLNFMKLY